MESKEYSWRWVTVAQVLSKGPCELVMAHLVVGAANNTATFYDGENTTGDVVVILQSAARTGAQFHPVEPVYCRKGLYIALSSNVDGVFVQWRELEHKAGS